jgi:hypothetical protein
VRSAGFQRRKVRSSVVNWARVKMMAEVVRRRVEVRRRIRWVRRRRDRG